MASHETSPLIEERTDEYSCDSTLELGSGILSELEADSSNNQFDPYAEVSRRYRDDDKSPWEFWKFTKEELREMVIQRSPYYLFPIWLQLKDYSCKDFMADLIAGIGVACMLIPQGLAYAILAGLPPIVGLYTAWFPLIVFACLTTSKHVAFGPDALGSLLVGLTLHKLVPHGGDVAAFASVLGFMVGVFLFLLGVVRFGFIDNVLSRPLLCGFVNAVALIILANQMVPFFGLPPTDSEITYEIVAHVFTHITELEWTTFLLGVLALLILGLLRVLRHFFPSSPLLKFLIGNLIVVVVGIVLSFSLKLENKNVRILGDVAGQFPTPWLPQLGIQTIADTFFEAVVIAVIGFIESMAATKLYANKHGYQISPNRELVAIGMANILGSFFRTYPTFGSLTRTAMADFYGAKSQIYTLVTTCFVLATILFLGPVFYFLPRTMMAAIIVIAAISLFEFHDIVFLWKIRAWSDLVLLFLTLLATVILGPDLGIFIGVGLSLLMVVKQSAFPHIAVLGQAEDGEWVNVATDVKAKRKPGIMVIRVEEALYFSNIEIIKDMFKRIQTYGSYKAHPTDKQEDEPIKNIIIHASNITDMDASAIQVLWEMMQDYQKNNVFVCFVKLRPHLKRMLIKSDIIGALGGNRVFHSLPAALRYIEKM